MPPAFRNHFMCDLRDVQKDFRAGNVADTYTDFLYGQFIEFCATL